MAKGNSTAAQTAGLSVEERQLVDTYRGMSRWEKNAVFLILQSITWGRLGEGTDKMSWEGMRQILGLRKAVRHG